MKKIDTIDSSDDTKPGRVDIKKVKREKPSWLKGGDLVLTRAVLNTLTAIQVWRIINGK